jgi:hypothetical protein
MSEVTVPEVSPENLNQPNVKHEEYPGKINFADVRGNYPGCAAIEFRDAIEMNSFFADNPNRLVVAVFPTQRRFMGGVVEFYITCLYTKILTDEEIAEFNEVQSEARRLIDERKAKREAARKLIEEEKVKQLQEQKRLLDLGRKCEENHGGLVEENRKLKKGKK